MRDLSLPVDSILGILYRPSIKRVVHATGSQKRAKKIYWIIYNFAGPNIKHVEVSGAKAKFNIVSLSALRVVNAATGVERPVIDDLIKSIEPGDVFYDIGANSGVYSCLIADILSDGDIVAFEPYPPTVELLESNLEINEVDATVMDVALADGDGGSSMTLHSNKEAGAEEHSLSRYSPNDNGVGSVEVALREGDSVVDDYDLPNPTVIKMDVEGAAPDALSGLERTIKQSNCRRIYVEPHGNSENIESLLENYGFDIEYIQLVGRRSTEPPTIVGMK
ncbi:hypothetical protein DJ84_21995 [Halorubrum ezzemoulense]|nr:hypothetical protein DJ84_21995 [Halorubrum ezzemoulense]